MHQHPHVPLSWFSLCLSLVPHHLLQVMALRTQVWSSRRSRCHALPAAPCRTRRCGQNPSVVPKPGPRQDGTSRHIPSLSRCAAPGSDGEQAPWGLLETCPLAHDKRKGPSVDKLQDLCLCCAFAPSKAACPTSASFGLSQPWELVCWAAASQDAADQGVMSCSVNEPALPALPSASLLLEAGQRRQHPSRHPPAQRSGSAQHHAFTSAASHLRRQRFPRRTARFPSGLSVRWRGMGDLSSPTPPWCPISPAQPAVRKWWTVLTVPGCSIRP